MRRDVTRGKILLREAIASAVTQPVASSLTILMVVGMVVVVTLTSGRAEGEEAKVLGSLDDAGTRTIQVDAASDAGLTTGVLDRIAHLDGVEWAGAFSAPVDATNDSIPDGTRVPVRLAYSNSLDQAGFPKHALALGQLAYGSPLALSQLGLLGVAGSVTTTDGTNIGVGGVFRTPSFLQSLEPLVLVPEPTSDSSANVNVLIVVTKRPDLVKPVSAAVVSLLAISDPSKVSIQTSEKLANLRALVQSQLGGFSRWLVVILLSATGLLVGIILYGLVLMRRKDFGRRRALGASRGFIVGLLLVQTGMLSLSGVVIGVTASVIALLASGDALPSFTFLGALGILAVATSIVSALVPALTASRREPIRELRVP